MKSLSRRQLLQFFWLNALGAWGFSTLQAAAMPIGTLLGNKNAEHVRFLLQRYFNWYQTEFYPFSQHLHKDEMGLIGLAIRQLPNWNEYLAPDQALDRFFVGHELHNNQITHGRLSVFTDLNQPQIKGDLERVLRRHGVAMSKMQEWIKGGTLYGVGWDCNQNIFKIYARFEDSSLLQHQKLKQLDSTTPIQFHNLRLACWRIQAGLLQETRLYRVQKEVSREAKSISSFGPYISQVTDILSDKGAQPAHWRLRSFPGVAIGKKLEALAEKQAQNYRFALDSIRYHSLDHIIAYYP